MPTYIDQVPSFNAANVWMMRELAAILEMSGKADEPAQLRGQADAMAKAVMGLYVPDKESGAACIAMEPESRCGTAMTSLPSGVLCPTICRRAFAGKWWPSYSGSC